MRTRTLVIEVPQPYAALLEQEAGGSRRSPEAHLLHILGRRYDNLIRVCGCGYFLYAPTDDVRCSECAAPCCPYCCVPRDNRDLCFPCAERQGIDTSRAGGFRAAPEGKV